MTKSNMAQRRAQFEKMAQSTLVSEVKKLDRLGRKTGGIRKRRREMHGVLYDKGRGEVHAHKIKFEKIRAFRNKVDRVRGLLNPGPDIDAGRPKVLSYLTEVIATEGGFVLYRFDRRGKTRSSYEECVLDFLRAEGTDEKVIEAALKPEGAELEEEEGEAQPKKMSVEEQRRFLDSERKRIEQFQFAGHQSVISQAERYLMQRVKRDSYSATENPIAERVWSSEDEMDEFIRQLPDCVDLIGIDENQVHQLLRGLPGETQENIFTALVRVGQHEETKVKFRIQRVFSREVDMDFRILASWVK